MATANAISIWVKNGRVVHKMSGTCFSQGSGSRGRLRHGDRVGRLRPGHRGAVRSAEGPHAVVVGSDGHMMCSAGCATCSLGHPRVDA
jgi:hypothetical protein